MPSINIPQKRIEDLFNTLDNKQDALVAGNTISLTEYINPNVITANTIGVWHFDSNVTDVVHNLSFYSGSTSNIIIDTSTYKFGSGSGRTALFDETYYKTSYYSNWFGPDISSYNLSSSTNCTLDFWYKPPTETSGSAEYRTCIFAFLANNPYASLGIRITPTSDNSKISFAWANDYSAHTMNTPFITDVAVSATFHHIALVFTGGESANTVEVYLDGILIGSDTVTLSNTSFAFKQFVIYGSSRRPYIDELRLSKGKVYTSNFSDNLPTTEYTTGTDKPTKYLIDTKNVATLTDLATKQDKLPTGTTGYFLQKTANDVVWTGIQVDSALSNTSTNAVQNKVVTQALTLRGLYDKISTVTYAASTTISLDDITPVYSLKPTGATTLAFDTTNLNIPENSLTTFYLILDMSDGVQTITWPLNVQWGNISPTMTANVCYMFSFTKPYGANIWIGNQMYSWGV